MAKLKSIKQIEDILKEVSYEELPNILEKISEDSRKGVQNLIKRYENKYKKYKMELRRIQDLNKYEKTFYLKGYQVIAGIDEVGRGPLAGPVVACAVILPPKCSILGINDSKKLSPTKREEFFDKIKKEALAVGIGIMSPETIDCINILQATYKAMEEAIKGLSTSPQILLIDGNNKIPNILIPQQTIIKGDERSISIAAASIIAKVTRDRLMDAYHELYPQYGFIKNKGYGTKEHIDAIKAYGLCPIHRKSFTQNI